MTGTLCFLLSPNYIPHHMQVMYPLPEQLLQVSQPTVRDHSLPLPPQGLQVKRPVPLQVQVLVVTGAKQQ